MIEPNSKHPKYDDQLIPPNNDVFKPEFKRDSRGRYFMQLPGYGKWMVGNEPGSKIIAQGSEDEAGEPALDVGSIKTGSLNVKTTIWVGDSICLDGGTGCIYVGDCQKRVQPSIDICKEGIKGYVANDTVFAFFLEATDNFGVGDFFIGDYGSDNYVLWDDSEGYLYVKGKIYATSGEIGGWDIGTCLKKEYTISTPSKTKIELCAGNPGHIQAAYSPTGSFSLPGDVYMVQITQGSTGDSGGVPIPRMDIYRNGAKRMMLNSDGLYFFESDGSTVASSILSGATNEENLSNVNITGGDISGPVLLPNAQTIATTTAHVIATGNSHSADLTDISDAQDYMARMGMSIDALPDATYIGYLWTHKLVATSPGTSGVIVYNAGIKGYDASNNETFFLNASTGDFYFGAYPSGNYISWATSGGTLSVKGEIRALTGYIGGDTTGWKIASNVMQAYSGATKVIELSVAGPHIQCLKDANNYVQMTPASSDPRFDVFVANVRRIRLNADGLTMYSSGGVVTNEIGLGVTDGDVTFASGLVRIFDKGIRISHDSGVCALNLQDEGSTYLRMFVDNSLRGYAATIELPNSDLLSVRDKTGPPGNKIIDFKGRTGLGNNYGLTDLLSPLGLLVKNGGTQPVPTGASNGWMFYHSGFNEVWAYINGSWEALDHGGGATGTVTSIATSGAITGGPITTTGTISHSTSSGYKHIPSGGSSYQTLRYSSSGTALWTSFLFVGGSSTSYLSLVGGKIRSNADFSINGSLHAGGNVYTGGDGASSGSVNAALIHLSHTATNPSSNGEIRNYASGATDQFRGVPGDGSWLGSFDMTSA